MGGEEWGAAGEEGRRRRPALMVQMKEVMEVMEKSREKEEARREKRAARQERTKGRRRVTQSVWAGWVHAASTPHKLSVLALMGSKRAQGRAQ